MADQPAPIEPLSYQTAMVAYLRDEEPDLWKWFSSNQVQQDQTDAVRLELLKSSLSARAQRAVAAQLGRGTAGVAGETPSPFVSRDQTPGR